MGSVLYLFKTILIIRQRKVDVVKYGIRTIQTKEIEDDCILIKKNKVLNFKLDKLKDRT